ADFLTGVTLARKPRERYTKGMRDVRTWIDEARREAAEAVARPGDWLTADERLDVWREARRADHDPIDRARRAAISPAALADRHPASDHLPAAAVDVVHRVATDPGRLSRAWADERIVELGVETYTELVGLTAIVRCLDTFAEALGVERLEPPSAADGEPVRRRPDDVGDVGAWVPQSVDKTLANVSRALSFVPETNEVWRGLVNSHYSRGHEFLELTWDRGLTRVQVEAVAARTTAELDCFY
ncbi:MAG: hypothetical protein OEW83_12750, partial [Acidimicrobiia bacterium]|nr:hypothetical protein [Acidimicrobiia bacterium]